MCIYFLIRLLRIKMILILPFVHHIGLSKCLAQYYFVLIKAHYREQAFVFLNFGWNYKLLSRSLPILYICRFRSLAISLLCLYVLVLWSLLLQMEASNQAMVVVSTPPDPASEVDSPLSSVLFGILSLSLSLSANWAQIALTNHHRLLILIAFLQFEMIAFTIPRSSVEPETWFEDA